MSLPARPLIFVACGLAGYFSARAFVADSAEEAVKSANATARANPQNAAAQGKPLVGIPEESRMVAEWEQLRREHGGDAGDLQALYAAIKETKDPYRRRAFRAALIADWAERDPAAGLTYLLEKDPQMAGQLMREWMRKDPNAAITRILAAGPKAVSPLRGLQSEIARQSPGRLAEVVNALRPSESRWDTSTRDAFAILAEKDLSAARAAAESVTGQLRSQALAGVAKAWAEKDGAAALAWAEAMAPGEARDAALKGALTGWARTDPVAALDKIDLVPPGGDEMAYASDVGAQVLQEAAGKNWDATMRWLADHPGKLGNSSLNGLQGALSKRLVKDPAATLREINAGGLPATLSQVFANSVLNEGYQARDAIWAWLDGQPPTAFNKAIRGSLINAIAWKEPGVVLEFLDRLPDTEDNASILERGAQSMLNGGSQMASLEGWLEKSPSKLRPYLLQAAFNYGSEQFATDPQLWLKRANELPEDRRLNAMASVASGWASADPEGALAWATALPDTGQRHQVILSAVGSWAQADPQSAAAWADSLPAGESRDGAAQALVYALNTRQPETAWAWALNIGDKGQRMSAIQTVYQTMRSKDAAIAEQMLQGASLSPDEMKVLQNLPRQAPVRAGTGAIRVF
jgi:hypothetical protein